MSNEIMSAVVAGAFLVIGALLSEILRSIGDRRRKPADLAEHFVPRRAELYREFLDQIVATSIQIPEPKLGDADPAELHLICNRAVYTLCPYAGIGVLDAVMKLSEVCAKYEIGAASQPNDFRSEFQFYLMDLLMAIRLDCLGDNIDDLVKSLRK